MSRRLLRCLFAPAHKTRRSPIATDRPRQGTSESCLSSPCKLCGWLHWVRLPATGELKFESGVFLNLEYRRRLLIQLPLEYTSWQVSFHHRSSAGSEVYSKVNDARCRGSC